MASGLVRRAVNSGDIFLVVATTVYVGNVSWSGVWQEVRRSPAYDCKFGCRTK